MPKAKKHQSFEFRSKKSAARAQEPFVHIYHSGARCETDTRGYPTPQNRSPLEIVVDATDGFIPLWDGDVSLRWRFEERSMSLFRDPEQAKDYIRRLFAQGLMLWREAAPIRFVEVRDGWDFEIVVSPAANCNPNGCVLASAFFPDAGKHELKIYPTMFDQTSNEQVETMAHEIGHIFGLRHFFADVSETRWKSEIFGTHSPFSIMNYGSDSRMTESDRTDLTTLYRLARSGELQDINGTPIRLVRPFSEQRSPLMAAGPVFKGRCHCCLRDG